MERVCMLRKAIGIAVLITLVGSGVMVSECYAKKSKDKAKDKAKGTNELIAAEKQAAQSGTKTIVVPGDSVSIEYVGKLEDGTVFSKTEPEKPFTFISGDGRLVPGLDKAIQGMLLNEEKTVTVRPEEAHGMRNETLVRTFPLKSLPENIKPELGMMLKLKDASGRPFAGTITNISDTDITVDLNHRLAGKTLSFYVKVVKIG